MHGSGMPGSRTEQGGTGKGLRVPSSRCFTRQECRGGGCYGKKESGWFFMAVANGWASEQAVLAAHGGRQPLPHAGTVSWVAALRAPPGAEGSCMGGDASSRRGERGWKLPGLPHVAVSSLAMSLSPTAGLCLVLSVQHGGHRLVLGEALSGQRSPPARASAGDVGTGRDCGHLRGPWLLAGEVGAGGGGNSSKAPGACRGDVGISRG